MSAAPLPKELRSDPKKQKPIVPAVKQFDNGINTTYRPSYAKKAYQLLKNSSTAKNKSHLCKAFHCSKPTLVRWLRKYPEFNAAVESGLEIGKSKWFDRVAKYAFKPTQEVNNGLIKLLSAVVYGIKEDEKPVIINNVASISGSFEDMLKAKGIPIPNTGGEDLEFGEPCNDDSC